MRRKRRGRRRRRRRRRKKKKRTRGRRKIREGTFQPEASFYLKTRNKIVFNGNSKNHQRKR